MRHLYTPSRREGDGIETDSQGIRSERCFYDSSAYPGSDSSQQPFRSHLPSQLTDRLIDSCRTGCWRR